MLCQGYKLAYTYTSEIYTKWLEREIIHIEKEIDIKKTLNGYDYTDFPSSFVR